MVHVIRLASFLQCGFHSVCPLIEKKKRVMEVSCGRDLLRGNVFFFFFFLMGGAIFTKSLIQFYIDGQGCVPFLLFTWGQTMVEVIKIMATSFQSSHVLQQATADPCLCWRLLDPHTSAGQSIVGSLFLSSEPWCLHDSVCAYQESVSPDLCKFWGL